MTEQKKQPITSLEKLESWIKVSMIRTNEASNKYQFFSSILRVVRNIEDSLNDFNFQYYNEELSAALLSDYARHIFAIHEDFRKTIADYLYDMDIDCHTIWNKMWPSIFGCEITDYRR